MGDEADVCLHIMVDARSYLCGKIHIDDAEHKHSPVEAVLHSVLWFLNLTMTYQSPNFFSFLAVNSIDYVCIRFMPGKDKKLCQASRIALSQLVGT